MDFSKEKKLVRRLAMNTKDGSVDWKPSLESEVFEVSFRDNTLRIYKAPFLNPDKGEPDVVIELVNSEGELAEKFTDVDLQLTRDSDPGPQEDWYRLLMNLHDAARRRALGADKVIDEILEFLDDQIPF